MDKTLKAFLITMRWDYAPYEVIVFAKTTNGALGKAKRRFPECEVLQSKQIRHIL